MTRSVLRLHSVCLTECFGVSQCLDQFSETIQFHTPTASFPAVKHIIVRSFEVPHLEQCCLRPSETHVFQHRRSTFLSYGSFCRNQQL